MKAELPSGLSVVTRNSVFARPDPAADPLLLTLLPHCCLIFSDLALIYLCQPNSLPSHGYVATAKNPSRGVFNNN
jgi:hypothetical protein